uniref:Uncharacterized protein n=1 Tax=Pristhesancus plagipennis TaxID=1955184 RepID=A0A2K8JVF1_PRIPG|nr:secreted hypothetical protein [Pristhesancus plagipennis]
MSSTTFLILIGILMTWNEGLSSQAQPLGIDDIYNVIEPKENSIDIWSKPRGGKVNIKQLILTIKKLDSKPKQYWNHNINESTINYAKMETIPTTTTTTTAKTLATRTANDNPEKFTNLHEQIETDQKRFFHSALDGWIF